MLSQSQGDDSISNRLPVVYASRLLSEAEKNYGVTDLKELASSQAITHLIIITTGGSSLSSRTILH